VFVASRDDDADYRNAVAQNASLHLVLQQETHFTLRRPGPIRPDQKLLNLKLASPAKPFFIEGPRAEGALRGPSHAHAHPATTFLQDARKQPEDLRRMLTSACFITSSRDPSQRSVDCCSPKPVPHSPNIVVYDVLGFGIDSFASRPRESRMNQGRKIPNDAHILLRLPIDSVMSFLSTISSVVPVDSDPERD
jgi:hypothetical protein